MSDIKNTKTGNKPMINDKKMNFFIGENNNYPTRIKYLLLCVIQ